MDNNEENYIQGTLSQNSANSNLIQWTPEINTPLRPWGQLVLVSRKVKTLGIKHSYNPGDQSSHTFDLHQETCSIGKYNCDIMLSVKYFSIDVLNQISRTHFVLKRNILDNGPVYLEDKSHNGTFVNGEKVGRGKTRIIESHDEITLGVKISKVFVFHDWHIISHLDVPECIKTVYYISKQIGMGASGVVNLSYNKRSCFQYAIKTVVKDNKIEGHDSLNNPKRLMNEVKIMKKLNHPFVVSIHDIVDTPKALYLVMQYMDKGDLQNFVTEKLFLKESDAKCIFYQIAEAVKYLHNQKIVHRDLKPQNILLNDCQKYITIAKVSDFGLSKFIDDSYLKTRCGTPLYNAPEVIKNSEGYTEKADIWSLGIILYFSLCGKEPFSRVDLENQICEAAYNFHNEIWATVSSSAQSLLKNILVVDSSKRLSIDGVLESEWLQEDLGIKEILNPTKVENKPTNIKHNLPNTGYRKEKCESTIIEQSFLGIGYTKEKSQSLNVKGNLPDIECITEKSQSTMEHHNLFDIEYAKERSQSAIVQQNLFNIENLRKKSQSAIEQQNVLDIEFTKLKSQSAIAQLNFSEMEYIKKSQLSIAKQNDQSTKIQNFCAVRDNENLNIKNSEYLYEDDLHIATIENKGSQSLEQED